MSRQERTARRTRQAAAAADAIIDEAVRKVKCRECGAPGMRKNGKVTCVHEDTCSKSKIPQHSRQKENFDLAMAVDKARSAPRVDSKPTGRRVRARVAETAGSNGSVDLSAECKRLRDEQGMAWWLIGKTLGLPGAGDSATTGKSGAARARSLYRQANGGAPPPRTHAERTHNGTNRARHAGNTGSKTERKLALLANGHVIPQDYTDEQVVALVAGRTVEWAINVARFGGGHDHWMNQEARVHPVDVIIDEDPDSEGGRVLRFREFLGYDQDQRSSRFGQPLGGATRTVRVNSIHTVR